MRFWFVLSIMGLFFMASISSLLIDHGIVWGYDNDTVGYSIEKNGNRISSNLHITNPGNVQSCADGTRAAGLCQAIEKRILASTVRIDIRSWIIFVEGVGYTKVRGGGHGTVKDGRYLITHNHFDSIPHSAFSNPDLAQRLEITIYQADGKQLAKISGGSLSVLAEDTETLVFDFGSIEGRGFFESLGIPSAKFLNGRALSLRPGMEVAQIDWDGSSSRVRWEKIESVKEVGSTLAIRLANCVALGSSGGGVFWEGIHIGNNWSRSTFCETTKSTGNDRNYSLVALNSARVTDK